MFRQDLKAAADHQDIAVPEGQAHAAVEIEVGDLRVPLQLRQDLRRQVLVVGRGGENRRPEEDVPADGPAHPVVHGLPEGADHHGHRDEHPQGAGQGGNGDGHAAERPGQVAAAQAGGRPFLQGPRQSLPQQPGRQRRQQGKTQQNEERRRKPGPGGAWAHLPGGEGRGQGQAEQPPPGDEPHPALELLFQFLPVPDGPEVGAGRLQGRQRRGHQGGCHRQPPGLQQQASLHPDFCGRHRHVQRSEVLGHHPQNPPGQADPQDQAEGAAHQAAHRALGQKQQQHLRRGHAQGAQEADLPAPPHHRQGHGLINEEHPHKQGDGAQNRQIEAVGGHQPFGARPLGSGPHHLHPRGELCPESRQHPGFVPRGHEVKVVQTPHPVQEFLGRGDIHEDHGPVQGIEAAFGAKNPGDGETFSGRAHQHRQGIPHLQAEARRQALAHQNGVGAGEKIDPGLIGQSATLNKFIIPKVLFGKFGKGSIPRSSTGPRWGPLSSRTLSTTGAAALTSGRRRSLVNRLSSRGAPGLCTRHWALPATAATPAWKLLTALAAAREMLK